MQDGIIAGNGNSRYLKTVAAALSLYPKYEDFIAALIAGTFPIDLNGINPSGWVQQGTPLNKANLFSDTTASSLGLSAANSPNDALAKLKQLIDNSNSNANTRAKIATGSYQGQNPAGFGQTSKTIVVGFSPSIFLLGRKDILSRSLGIFTASSPSDYPSVGGNYKITSSITSNGITLSGENYYFNENTYTYTWVAIG